MSMCLYHLAIYGSLSQRRGRPKKKTHSRTVRLLSQRMRVAWRQSGLAGKAKKNQCCVVELLPHRPPGTSPTKLFSTFPPFPFAVPFDFLRNLFFCCLRTRNYKREQTISRPHSAPSPLLTPLRPFHTSGYCWRGKEASKNLSPYQRVLYTHSSFRQPSLLLSQARSTSILICSQTLRALHRCNHGDHGNRTVYSGQWRCFCNCCLLCCWSKAAVKEYDHWGLKRWEHQQEVDPTAH